MDRVSAGSESGSFLAYSSTAGQAHLKSRIVAGVAGLVLLGGAGLGFYYAHAKADPVAAAAPAATPVAAETVRPRTVHPWSSFSGRITAVNYAEIRPEVSGRISEIRFHDGQDVRAGDILLVIDPRPYQAAVEKAEGDLASVANNAKLAKIELDRGTKLVAMQAIAQEGYDQRVNVNAVAQAAIQSAQAVLAQARLNVDHAYVKAPISGRVSRAEITLGNLVGTSPAPLLTSIASDDGVYADFEVDEQTYLNSVRNRAQTAAQEQKIAVELTVNGDSGHVYQGKIESFDNRIDTASGTIRARARFDNKDGALVPGMFVSVRMVDGTLDNALLVPERAIGNDQSKRFLFVVNKDSKAEYRPVTLGPEMDGERIVLSGIRAGERVIVDGVQRLGPGAPVQVQPPDRAASAH
jgi:multidrug efflux system membrane fusion protein